MRSAVVAALGAAVLGGVCPGAVWAQASTASPRQVALARDVIEASGQRESLAMMMRTGLAQIAEATAKSLPPEKQASSRAGSEAMQATMAKFSPRIVDLSADAYARTFSEQELTQILAFQRSPVGQAMRAKTPELTRNVLSSMAMLMPQIQQDFRAEFCKREACPTPANAPPAPAN